MKVVFATKQLQARYENSQRAIRAWGPEAGRKYIGRINILLGAKNLDDLRDIPQLRLHQLSGKRKGQHAINIDRTWRLLIAYELEQNAVLVKEVTNHYGG